MFPEILLQEGEKLNLGLAEGRDRKRYRDKGKRRTTIKTVFEEVEYSRHIYQTETKAGRHAYVYLLDEVMTASRKVFRETFVR